MISSPALSTGSNDVGSALAARWGQELSDPDAIVAKILEGSPPSVSLSPTVAPSSTQSTTNREARDEINDEEPCSLHDDGEIVAKSEEKSHSHLLFMEAASRRALLSAQEKLRRIQGGQSSWSNQKVSLPKPSVTLSPSNYRARDSSQQGIHIASRPQARTMKDKTSKDGPTRKFGEDRLTKRQLSNRDARPVPLSPANYRGGRMPGTEVPMSASQKINQGGDHVIESELSYGHERQQLFARGQPKGLKKESVRRPNMQFSNSDMEHKPQEHDTGESTTLRNKSIWRAAKPRKRQPGFIEESEDSSSSDTAPRRPSAQVQQLEGVAQDVAKWSPHLILHEWSQWQQGSLSRLVLPMLLTSTLMFHFIKGTLGVYTFMNSPHIVGLPSGLWLLWGPCVAGAFLLVVGSVQIRSLKSAVLLLVDLVDGNETIAAEHLVSVGSILAQVAFWFILRGAATASAMLLVEDTSFTEFYWLLWFYPLQRSFGGVLGAVAVTVVLSFLECCVYAGLYAHPLWAIRRVMRHRCDELLRLEQSCVPILRDIRLINSRLASTLSVAVLAGLLSLGMFVYVAIVMDTLTAPYRLYAVYCCLLTLGLIVGLILPLVQLDDDVESALIGLLLYGKSGNISQEPYLSCLLQLPRITLAGLPLRTSMVSKVLLLQAAVLVVICTASLLT